MVGVYFVIISVAFCACARGAVINGELVHIRHYPHAVSYGACVATLISERWVLTAAHCYRPWYRTLYVMGLPDGSRRRSIKQSVVHPRYRLGDNYVNDTKSEIYATYDYLLLELREPLRSARYLKLEDAPEPPAGTKATFPSLESFGSTTYMENTHLYHGELFTLTDAECARRVQSFDPVTMLCAVGGAPKHSGACFGDSGSGLVAEGRLLGVLSWVEKDAIDCGADRVVVSARLSNPEIKQWIKSVMREGDETAAAAASKEEHNPITAITVQEQEQKWAWQT